MSFTFENMALSEGFIAGMIISAIVAVALVPIAAAILAVQVTSSSNLPPKFVQCVIQLGRDLQRWAKNQQ